MKHLRKKSDGYIYSYSPILAARMDMETFEFDGPVPDRIENLMDFMTAAKSEPKGRRKKTEAEEPTPE